MTNGIDIYDLIRMICLVASLILALVIYALLGEHGHDKSRTSPFVNLNGSFITPGIRCAYLFVAIAALVLAVIDITQICIEGTDDELSTTLFSMIFGLLIFEVLLRIVADLIILIACALQSVCSRKQEIHIDQPMPAGPAPMPMMPPVVGQTVPNGSVSQSAVPSAEEAVSEPVARVAPRDHEYHPSDHDAEMHPADHQMTERVRAAIEAANSIDDSLIDPALMTDDAAEPALSDDGAFDVAAIDPASFDPRSFDQDTLGSYVSVAETPTTRIDIQQSWDCTCGARGNVGAYCGHCGAPRPDPTHE